MKQNILLPLVPAGLLFSGYLGGLKLFNDKCAFNETCATFLGYPTCYYSFVMYLIIFTLLVALRMRIVSALRSLSVVIGISFVGILFAGCNSIC